MKGHDYPLTYVHHFCHLYKGTIPGTQKHNYGHSQVGTILNNDTGIYYNHRSLTIEHSLLSLNAMGDPVDGYS